MNHKLALAILAGISIGAAGSVVVHAQQTKTPPPAHVIADVEVTDKFAKTPAFVEGHYLAERLPLP